VAVMYAGKVMEYADVEELFTAPRHPYTTGLLASLVPFGAHYSDQALHILAGTPPDPINPEPGCPFAPRCPLRRDECGASVPAVRNEEGASYRCIVPGIKQAELFSRGRADAGAAPETEAPQ